MEDGERKNKKIELAFPKYEEEDQEYISKGRGEDLIKYLSTSMDEVTNWFHQYQVDSIGLSISGAIENRDCCDTKRWIRTSNLRFSLICAKY